MVDMLLNIYTWRGAMMILSGFFLNMIVCGALMRPVETHIERRHRQRLAWLEHLARESGLPPPLESADYIDKDVLGRIKLLRDRMLAPRRVTMSYLHSTNEVSWKINSDTARANPRFVENCIEISENGKSYPKDQSHIPLAQSNLLPIPEESPLLQHNSNQDAHEQKYNSLAFNIRKAEVSESADKKMCSSNHLNPGTKLSSENRSYSQDKYHTGSGNVVTDKFVELNDRCATTENPVAANSRITHSPPASGKMCAPYPSFCKGNQAHINHDFYDTNSLKLTHNDPQSPTRENILSHTPSFCGISTCLMPFLNTFLSMAAYASVFGMGLAANDALCTVLLVEFVGLHRLTNGLGICFFCQGVANILGPPMIASTNPSAIAENCFACL
ncbi:unnamed protein product [Heterobilharzia americana]|nr:unnamed protein product [Heterobilharzia americana]